MSSGRKVLCHGVFDLLHPGHIAHLTQARGLGDRLVVSITADLYVDKGPGRPVFSTEQRLYMLQALSVVDAVIVSTEPTAIGSIRLVSPSVYVKGPDYKYLRWGDDPVWDAELAALGEVNGRVHFTTGPKLSSTEIIERIAFPNAV
jgi:rfaE bifunctional protein nucleotidyltransferase chain/domain